MTPTRSRSATSRRAASLHLIRRRTSIITERSPYIVRTSFTLAQSSTIIGDWAAKNGIKKVAVLVSDYAPGADALNFFKAKFTAGGGEIVEEVKVPLAQPGFAPFLQRMKDSKPDAVFVFVPAGQGGNFMKQYADASISIAASSPGARWRWARRSTGRARPRSPPPCSTMLRRSTTRADAMIARASVHLLAGEADQAAALAETATLVSGVSPRAHYVLGRSLIAAGKTQAGLAALKLYSDSDPIDPRTRRLLASKGAEPQLAPAPPTLHDDPAVRLGGSFEKAGAESAAFGFHVDWPLTWRVVAVSASPGTGMMLNLSTGRVILDDGDTERGTATLLVQHPDSPAERSELLRKAGRNLFPDAKLRTLPALLPGSKREQFRETQEGSVHQGEVTTVEKGGTVYFLVLNASREAYGKLKEEYAGVVKSLSLSQAAAAPAAPK